jgi:hypothetical protein
MCFDGFVFGIKKTFAYQRRRRRCSSPKKSAKNNSEEKSQTYSETQSQEKTKSAS